MAKELKIRITADSDGLRKGVDDAEGHLKGFGSKMGALGLVAGGALAAGVGAGVAGIGGLIASGIGGASDMNETISKSKVLFGDAFTGVEQFAEGAATSLGQSKQEALDAAATFATFGKSAGLSGDDLAEFATANNKLAVDMASFGNTSSEEAIEAIGAAFRGEAEPIRKYGILLDDATLRQKALELGLISTTKEALTPQQKVLAAQAAIVEQAADAQDDFAETSGGLAGQQKILGAAFTNFKTELGTAFLPVVLDVVTALNTKFMPLLREFGPIVAEKIAGGVQAAVGWFQELVKVFQDGGLKAALGSVAKDLMGLFVDYEIWLWGTAYPAIGRFLISLGQAMGNWIVETAVPYLAANLPVWLATFGAWFDSTAWPWMVAMTEQLAVKMADWVVQAAAYLAANLPIWLQQFGAWFDGTAFPWLVAKALELAAAMADWVLDSAQRLLQNLPVWIGKFTSWWHTEGFPKVIEIGAQLGVKLIGAMGDLAGDMVQLGVDIVQGLIDGMLSMAGDLASAATELAGKVTGAVTGALSIGSPSKVFREIGMFSAMGLRDGLLAGSPMVAGAAGSLAGVLTSQPFRAAYTPSELSGGMAVGGSLPDGWGPANRTGDVYLDGRVVGRTMDRPNKLNARAIR